MKRQIIWPKVLVNFIGWIFLLIGIFFSLKTIFNFMYYKNKYPIDPVIGVSFSFPKYEQDCYQMIINIIPPYSSEELKNNKNEIKKNQQKLLNACINKIKRAREETKIKDIWTSFMFIFLGSGVLLTKRFYLKEN